MEITAVHEVIENEENIEYSSEEVLGKTINTVIIGDSLAKGDDGQSYKGHANISDWLKYFTRKPIINNGIWGDTLDGVIKRLATDVIKLKPKYAIILVGTNDINNGTDTKEMVKKAMIIGQTLKNNNIKPIFISIPPRNDKPELNSIIRDYNLKLAYWCDISDFQFVDIYSHLADFNGNAAINGVLSFDDLHWTPQGAYVAAKTISGYYPIFNDNIQNRFSTTELLIEDVNDSTRINNANANFNIEVNLNKKMGTMSEYQVISKTSDVVGSVGISQKIYFQPSNKYRVELDIEWEMIGNIDSDTTLRGVISIETSDGVYYQTFLDSYNLLNAKFRPFVDIDIPQGTKNVTIEIYGFGASHFNLKIGRVETQKLS